MAPPHLHSKSTATCCFVIIRAVSEIKFGNSKLIELCKLKRYAHIAPSRSLKVCVVRNGKQIRLGVAHNNQPSNILNLITSDGNTFHAFNLLLRSSDAVRMSIKIKRLMSYDRKVKLCRRWRKRKRLLMTFWHSIIKLYHGFRPWSRLKPHLWAFHTTNS